MVAHDFQNRVDTGKVPDDNIYSNKLALCKNTKCVQCHKLILGKLINFHFNSSKVIYLMYVQHC